MHKIVLFIEPSDDAFATPFKVGHLFMNRLAIDENASFEIIKTLEFSKTSSKMSWSDKPEYLIFLEERNQKGTSLIHMNNMIKGYVIFVDKSLTYYMVNSSKK